MRENQNNSYSDKGQKVQGKWSTRIVDYSLHFHYFTNPSEYLILIIFLKEGNRETKTMAEGALFQLAGKVLELLGSFTLPEVKRAFGVQTEIEKLTSTVSTIQAVILDAEKQSSHNHQIKDWL